MSVVTKQFNTLEELNAVLSSALARFLVEPGKAQGIVEAMAAKNAEVEKAVAKKFATELKYAAKAPGAMKELMLAALAPAMDEFRKEQGWMTVQTVAQVEANLVSVPVKAIIEAIEAKDKLAKRGAPAGGTRVQNGEAAFENKWAKETSKFGGVKFVNFRKLSEETKKAAGLTNANQWLALPSEGGFSVVEATSPHSLMVGIAKITGRSTAINGKLMFSESVDIADEKIAEIKVS